MRISRLGFPKFPIHQRNMGNRYVLWTFYFTGTGVGTCTKAELIHSLNQLPGTLFMFHLTLWQSGKMADFRRGKQSRTCVFATGDTGSATDACSRIEGLLYRFA